MNTKLVLLGSGAVLIPSIAVPASLSLKSSSPIIEIEEEKTPQPQPQPQPTEKPKKVEKTTFEPFSKKRGTNAKEDFYMSKYQGYFLHPHQNKQEWEAKFASLGRGPIIIYEDDDEDESLEIAITSPWSTSIELDSKNYRNLSLNSFCAKSYYSEGKKENGSWGFNPEDDLATYISEARFWQLCSSFILMPDTVADMENKASYMPYKDNQIGYLLRDFLVSSIVNGVFWPKRQSEWKSLDITDSIYFSNKNQKSILDLCEDAYKKEPAKGQDTADAPTLDNARKYCSLEWDF